MSVYTTVNAPFKDIILEEDIARIISSMSLPKEYTPHIAQFFTEVPIAEVDTFIKKYRISPQTLKKYYLKYMAPAYKNKKLEEYLYYA